MKWVGVLQLACRSLEKFYDFFGVGVFRGCEFVLDWMFVVVPYIRHLIVYTFKYFWGKKLSRIFYIKLN